jgi:hypothetical protein
MSFGEGLAGKADWVEELMGWILDDFFKKNGRNS